MCDLNPSGTPRREDPEVVAGMGMYDNLNDRERGEVFRSTWRAVLAWRRTGDPGHLATYAATFNRMVVSESKRPTLRELIRNRPTTAAEAGGVVPVETVLALLRDPPADPGDSSGESTAPTP